MANHYDLHARDVLHFHDQLAQHVVDGLRVRLSPTEQASLVAPITQSPEAYDLYLQARFQWTEFSIRSTRSSLHRGQRLLEQAVALDSSFAHAYALLGLLFAYEAANFVENAAESLRRAELALHIDPQLADGWIALGFAHTQGGRNEDAIRTLRRALELAPNSDFAWDIIAYAYHYAGLNEHAEKAARRGRALNPTSRRLRWMHGRFLLYLDRIPEAIAAMDFASSAEHSKALAHLGKFLYYAGRLAEADAAFEQALALPGSREEMAIPLLAAYLRASRNERDRISPAVLALQPSAVLDGDQAYWTGGVHALLGDKDAALAWFGRANDLGNHNYPWFSRDRNYDRLRGDPDYERILAEVRRKWEQYKKLFGP
jgi:tetratricopeptide (TPR) repeat protein